MDIRTKLCNLIKKSKNYKKLYNIPYLIKLNKKQSLKGFKIAIVSVPCGGYGDIVFAIKLFHYCKKWYKNANIKIITNFPDMFKTLGIQSKNIIKVKNKGAESLHCSFSEKFIHKSIPKSFQNPDIILSMLDGTEYEELRIKSMKNILKSSNRFNTYYTTEYNVSNNNYKNVRLPTGVGQKNLGLLLQKRKKYKKIKSIKHPYLVAYIAGNISDGGVVDDALKCLGYFINRSLKHVKSKIVEVIIPKHIGKEIKENLFDGNIHNFTSKIPDKFKIIRLKTKEENILLTEDDDQKGKTLILNATILPLPREKMMGLYQHSLKNILVTGDQSITDVLTCCPDKLIWYQIAEWKRLFAQGLAKDIPFKAFKSTMKACGKKSYKKPSYKKLLKENDFRIKGKLRLDKIINYVATANKNEDIQEFEDIVMHSKTKKSVLNKYCI